MKKTFIAIAVGVNSNSGFKNTWDECANWAAKFLSGHPPITRVLICETVAFVERSALPVVITEIVSSEDFPEQGKAPNPPKTAPSF